MYSGVRLSLSCFLDYIFNDPGHPSDQVRPGVGPGGQGRRGHSSAGSGFSGIKFDTSEVRMSLALTLNIFFSSLSYLQSILNVLMFNCLIFAGWTDLGVIQSAFGNNLLNQNNLSQWIQTT